MNSKIKNIAGISVGILTGVLLMFLVAATPGVHTTMQPVGSLIFIENSNPCPPVSAWPIGESQVQPKGFIVYQID
jgi:hypothetical protein